MAVTVIYSIIHFLLSVIGKTAVVWAPLALGYTAFNLWHHFAAERFISGMEWVLLEVEIPREVDRPLLGMELFFTNALYHMSSKGVWETFVQGAVHFWFSLEIVSIDGKVRFFIRTPSRLKKLVETQLYAQYPQVRVTEAEDYTLNIPRYDHHGDWNLWGCEFKLSDNDFLPLQTYVHYGLDKAGDEEKFKVDPLTSTIEFLGALDRGEQVWIQMIVRPSEKKFVDHHGHKINFYDACMQFLTDTLAPFKRIQKNDNAENSFAFDARTPEYLKDMVTRVKEKMAKVPFDTGIRLVVLGDKRLISTEQFNMTRRSSRLLFHQYSNVDSNRLERFNSTQFDTTFSDPTGASLRRLKARMLTYYKLRTMYYPPLFLSFQWPWPISLFTPSNPPSYFVLNTEELATIFHFPGMVSETPSFNRLETRTAKPPTNLPT